MKSKNLILAAMLMAMPSTIMAQQNIKKAFDALLSDNITENKTRHVLDRDSETGRMTALADVYDFTISNATSLDRLNDIRKAFDKPISPRWSVHLRIRVSSALDHPPHIVLVVDEDVAVHSVPHDGKPELRPPVDRGDCHALLRGKLLRGVVRDVGLDEPRLFPACDDAE